MPLNQQKGGVVMLVPSFLCTKGLFKDAWHGFFRISDAFKESLLVVILIGSLHLYMISPSPPLKLDGISGYLKCFSYAMKLGCVLSPSCYLSMLPFLFSFATDVVLFSEGSVFADKIADVSVFAF